MSCRWEERRYGLLSLPPKLRKAKNTYAKKSSRRGFTPSPKPFDDAQVLTPPLSPTRRTLYFCTSCSELKREAVEVKDRVIVVTGAGSGIGRALAQRFVSAGAKSVACADINRDGAEQTAASLGDKAIAYATDVSDEAAIVELVQQVEKNQGAISVFCSNAGIAVAGNENTPNSGWDASLQINLMAHVYAARAIVPLMLERGEGYLVNTASAAGLLTQIGSATYSVTKHAAIALAEFLAISYGDKGIRVSVLCPQAVRTAMTAGSENGGVAGVDGMMSPEEVAEKVLKAMREECFLILPHEQVRTYMQRKTSDYDRWISGMRRLRDVYLGDEGS